MALKNDSYFFNDLASPSNSKEVPVKDASAITLQVETASGSPTYNIIVTGVVSPFSEDYKQVVYSDAITSDGNYIIGVLGFYKIRVEVKALSGGKINVFGRLTS